MRRTGSYAVVGGHVYEAGYSRGRSKGVRLRRLVDLGAAPSDDALGEAEFVPRDAPWDDVERLMDVTVWWRGPGGVPVVEMSREGDQVWVETRGGQPYGPSAADLPVPEFLPFDNNDRRYEGPVDADLLHDRCEVERELDVANVRIPGDALPRDKEGWPVIPSTVIAERVLWD